MVRLYETPKEIVERANAFRTGGAGEMAKLRQIVPDLLSNAVKFTKRAVMMAPASAGL